MSVIVWGFFFLHSVETIGVTREKIESVWLNVIWSDYSQLIVAKLKALFLSTSI